MPRDMMLKCEQKKPFMVEGQRVERWAEVNVLDIPKYSRPKVRCIHCNGAVRIHRQHAPKGPQDHVEHRKHQDSAGCKGGVYFVPPHRRSLYPIDE